MLDLFQRRKRPRSAFQQFGDQFSRVTQHRRAQAALSKARQEADRYTAIARTAMRRAEEANRAKTEFLAIYEIDIDYKDVKNKIEDA